MAINQTQITTSFDIITEAFQNTPVFGEGWVIGAMITILTLVLITREYKQWGILAPAVITAWQVVGIKMNLMLWIMGIIAFVLSALSEITIGDILRIRTKPTTEEIIGKETTKEPIAWSIHTKKPTQWRTSTKEIKAIKTAKQQARGLKERAKQALKNLETNLINKK